MSLRHLGEREILQTARRAIDEWSENPRQDYFNFMISEEISLHARDTMDAFVDYRVTLKKPEHYKARGVSGPFRDNLIFWNLCAQIIEEQTRIAGEYAKRPEVIAELSKVKR